MRQTRRLRDLVVERRDIGILWCSLDVNVEVANLAIEVGLQFASSEHCRIACMWMSTYGIDVPLSGVAVNACASLRIVDIGCDDTETNK